MNELPGTPPDFSLVLGGPLYSSRARNRLTDDACICCTDACWRGGAGLGAAAAVVDRGRDGLGRSVVTLPFLRDVELHVRLLIALPLMIGAELFVHKRMRPVVGALSSSAG